MASLAFGIDLGTSTSEICVYNNGQLLPISDPRTKSPVVPSIVGINKRGELVVGEDARSIADLPGRGAMEFKRLMGTGEGRVQLMEREYRPEELSALVLRRLQANAEAVMGTTVTDVVVSVPAFWPDSAKAATRAATEIAGLNAVRLVAEPTAAAMAFGVNHLDAEECVVVFDFGGGTLDISVVEMMEGVLEVRCSFGDPQLGGKDVDAALIGYALERFRGNYPGVDVPETAIPRLKSECERLKKTLSTSVSAEGLVPALTVAGGLPIDFEFELTRRDLDSLLSPLLKRARSCVEEGLARNSKRVERSAISRVLLVGGTTYIPAVRQLVAEIFGCEPSAEVEPDLAVAKGAAVQAALSAGLIERERGLIVTDVAPFGLGIDVVNDVGGRLRLVYEPLVEPQTTIPYSVRRRYSLLHDEQDQVEVHLYQDPHGTARTPDDAVDTGIVGLITDIPPSFSGEPHPIEIAFSYDIDGLVRLRATLPDLEGKEAELVYRASEFRMNDSELEEYRSRLASGESAAYDSLEERAEALLKEKDSPELARVLADFRAARASSNLSATEAAADDLTAILFRYLTEG